MCFQLLAILTGQGDISEVLVFYQVSKDNFNTLMEAIPVTAHSIHLLHVFSNGLLDCKHGHIGYIMIFVGVFLLQPVVCGSFLPKA